MNACGKRAGHDAGFTLIEMLIVTALIGILAGVAVPNLVSSRATASERAVIATLRTIATAQGQCMSTAALDQDRNGTGEACSLAELSGAAVLRSQTTAMTPPLLSATFGDLDPDGHVRAHGFLFALHLPDSGGSGVAASATNLPTVDPRQSEAYWSCIAWPANPSTQPRATYFINQIGQIVASYQNPYVGKTRVPAAGAALLGVPETSIATNQLANGVPGADGFVWSALR